MDRHQSILYRRVNFFASVLIIIIGISYIAADLIAPLLTAAMFAVLLLPIFRWYRKRGLSKGISLVGMILTVIACAFGVIYLLQFSFGLISESIHTVLTETAKLDSGNELIDEIGHTVSPEQVLGVLNKISASISGLFLYLLVIPVLAIVLVAQIDSFSDNFKMQLTQNGPSINKYRKFAASINAYIIGRFKVNLSTALLLTPALLLMGVDYAILWGFLTLILCFIPYIGIFIAGVGPFLIVIAHQGLGGAVALLIIYLVITSITENIIDPLVQGKENRLTTMSLIVGFIFWSWLFGVLGTIIAAPLTVMIKTIFEDYEETQWIAMLMVGDYSSASKKTRDYRKMLRSLKNKLPRI